MAKQAATAAPKAAAKTTEKPAPVGGNSAKTLAHLAKVGQASKPQLREKLGLTGLGMPKLEELGFVVRQAAPEGEKGVQFKITAAGKKAAAKL